MKFTTKRLRLILAGCVFSGMLSSNALAQPTQPSPPPKSDLMFEYRQSLSQLNSVKSINLELDSVINDLIPQSETGFQASHDLAFCGLTPAVFSGATNPRYYFLSEVIPAGIGPSDTACGAKLSCFLKKIAGGSPHSNGTLIIDRKCAVNQPLIVPNRFTLAGVGINGEGQLDFSPLPPHTTAIQFQGRKGTAPQRHVTIRDLSMSGGATNWTTGINVSNSSFVTIENVRITDFAFGITGSTAFSISIDKSSIHNNGINVILGQNATSWRIRDTTMNQSGLVSIVFANTARGNLISGARIENNPVTGIHMQGPLNVIENSWFEGNGIFFGQHGIKVRHFADQTRILSNLFSSQLIEDHGTHTQMCFNTDHAPAANENNNCPM